MERLSVTVRLFPYLSPHQLQSLSSCPFVCSVESFTLTLETNQPKNTSLLFIFLKMGIWLCNELMFAGVALQHTAMSCSGADWDIVKYLGYWEKYCGVQSKSPGTSTQHGKLQICGNAVIMTCLSLPPCPSPLWNYVCTKEASQEQPDFLQGKSCALETVSICIGTMLK